MGKWRCAFAGGYGEVWLTVGEAGAGVEGGAERLGGERRAPELLTIKATYKSTQSKQDQFKNKKKTQKKLNIK